MARFTLLRWAVNEDDDDWLARRGISRSKGCAFCAKTGRTYPFGGCQVVICENCISLKQITAFTVDELEVPEPRGSASVRNQDSGRKLSLHALYCMHKRGQHSRTLDTLVQSPNCGTQKLNE